MLRFVEALFFCINVWISNIKHYICQTKQLKTSVMKVSKYKIESNFLIATITKGVKTRFDWFLEVQTKCGGKLICKEFQTIHLTKKSATKEFMILKSSTFLIKQS